MIRRLLNVRKVKRVVSTLKPVNRITSRHSTDLKMNSNFQMDALLEEKLNDIDELIRSELEYEPQSPTILNLQSLDFMLNDPAYSPGKKKLCAFCFGAD